MQALQLAKQCERPTDLQSVEGQRYVLWDVPRNERLKFSLKNDKGRVARVNGARTHCVTSRVVEKLNSDGQSAAD